MRTSLRGKNLGRSPSLGTHPLSGWMDERSEEAIDAATSRVEVAQAFDVAFDGAGGQLVLAGEGGGVERVTGGEERVQGEQPGGGGGAEGVFAGRGCVGHAGRVFGKVSCSREGRRVGAEK